MDYGLARKFRYSDGKPIERRKRAGFRGTLRYVSIRVHDRKEQGPSDDLIALFFTLIEILKGELPWRNEKSDEKMKNAKMQLVIFRFLIHQCLCQSFFINIETFSSRLILKSSKIIRVSDER